jgi:ABC-type branched-subunit amino acid transport system substrate-binding protein
MVNWRGLKKATVVITIAAVTTLACGAQPTANTPTATDIGVTSNSITIGATFPLSGTASAYAAVAKGMNAYFQYINDKGGVNGRKITFTVVDDVYNAANTPAKARELVDQDKIFAAVGNLGTGPNLAVRQYYNDNKVPDLFVFTGSNHWGGDFAQYPWTLGWQPDYQAEGKIYAKDILKNNPSAKIAILYQNDDYGKDYVKGITDGLGAQASSMIVKTATYNAGDPPDMSSQVNQLKASGADTFYVVTTPAYSASALKNSQASGWKPAHIYLNGVGASTPIVQSVLRALGNPAALDGMTTTTYLKDPNDPAQAQDPGIVKYNAIITQYGNGCQVIDAFCVAGVACAFTFIDVIQQAGSNMTRKNVMDIAATKLNETNNFLVLNGITVKTTATDHYPIRQEKLEKWQGSSTGGRYVPTGDIISGR